MCHFGFPLMVTAALEVRDTASWDSNWGHQIYWLTKPALCHWGSPQANLPMVGMLWFMSDINQPSLPTPFYSLLESVSVFMALSTVFHSINSPNNSPLSLSVLLVSFLPYCPFIYVSMKVSLSPDIILCGWLGLKHQLTNYLPLGQASLHFPLRPEVALYYDGVDLP